VSNGLTTILIPLDDSPQAFKLLKVSCNITA